MDPVKEITLDISVNNGWYIATSKDLKGFFVAHEDFEVFLKEIPEVIKLIKNHGEGSCIVHVSPIKKLAYDVCVEYRTQKQMRACSLDDKTPCS